MTTLLCCLGWMHQSPRLQTQHNATPTSFRGAADDFNAACLHSHVTVEMEAADDHAKASSPRSAAACKALMLKSTSARAPPSSASMQTTRSLLSAPSAAPPGGRMGRSAAPDSRMQQNRYEALPWDPRLFGPPPSHAAQPMQPVFAGMLRSPPRSMNSESMPAQRSRHATAFSALAASGIVTPFAINSSQLSPAFLSASDMTAAGMQAPGQPNTAKAPSSGHAHQASHGQLFAPNVEATLARLPSKMQLPGSSHGMSAATSPQPHVGTATCHSCNGELPDFASPERLTLPDLGVTLDTLLPSHHVRLVPRTASGAVAAGVGANAAGSSIEADGMDTDGLGELCEVLLPHVSRGMSGQSLQSHPPPHCSSTAHAMQPTAHEEVQGSYLLPYSSPSVPFPHVMCVSSSREPGQPHVSRSSNRRLPVRAQSVLIAGLGPGRTPVSNGTHASSSAYSTPSNLARSVHGSHGVHASVGPHSYGACGRSPYSGRVNMRRASRLSRCSSAAHPMCDLAEDPDEALLQLRPSKTEERAVDWRQPLC